MGRSGRSVYGLAGGVRWSLRCFSGLSVVYSDYELVEGWGRGRWLRSGRIGWMVCVGRRIFEEIEGDILEIGMISKLKISYYTDLPS